jgi:hypothetical protein
MNIVAYDYVLRKLHELHKNQDMDLYNARLSKQDFQDILHLWNILVDSLVVFLYSLTDKNMLELNQLHDKLNLDHMEMERKGFR